MSESIGYVYTLNDPRTGEPKYVGATQDPNSRLDTHQHGATSDDVSEWLSELESSGEQVNMTLVEVTELQNLGEKEQEVIQRLSEEWELLNAESSPLYTEHKESGESDLLTVHDSVKEVVSNLADERGITMKEAVRDVFKEAGYDV